VAETVLAVWGSAKVLNGHNPMKYASVAKVSGITTFAQETIPAPPRHLHPYLMLEFGGIPEEVHHIVIMNHIR